MRGLDTRPTGRCPDRVAPVASSDRRQKENHAFYVVGLPSLADNLAGIFLVAVGYHTGHAINLTKLHVPAMQPRVRFSVLSSYAGSLFGAILALLLGEGGRG